ncbi:hypothetical protein F443_13988 [Phytophthora nicotianae P1569]|uniref:BZIP domain-containing protein n=1 Tax=Phytophthora nicotianae P1569 TaxID=1317065 RepID=V9EN84_PHYNI|nr:hypothetical protein F443_13988 [Phytophthora nicotianae P1569]
MPSPMYGDMDFLLDEASVFAFLADCDLVDEMEPVPTISTTSHCGAMSTQSDSSSSCITSEEPVEKKKSWRQRRKEEILNLRDEVKQLSAELQQLKYALGVHSRYRQSKKIKAAKDSSPFSSHASIWENTAQHQANLRSISEQENTNLRESLEYHIQKAKSLNRAVKRKLRAILMSPEMDMINQLQHHSKRATPPLNNEAVFNQLKVGIDELYGGLDIFFKQVGMDQLSRSGLQKNSMNSGARMTLVEFLDSYAIPFDLLQIEKAIWTPDTADSEDPAPFFMQSATDDNTRMISMGFPFSLEGIDFSIVMRIVTRKYVEKDRVVFITRSLIEPSIGPLSFVETNRRVLLRGEPSSLGPTTIILTHREAVSYGDLLSSDMTGCPSIEIGLKTWEGFATQYNYALEDKLIRTSSK